MLKTYRYTIENKDEWRITDTEIIIIAYTKTDAITMLKRKGYDNVNPKLLTKMEIGLHIIQEQITE